MKTSYTPLAASASLRLQGEPPLPGIAEGRGSVWENFAHELRQPLSVIESLAFYLELTSKDQGACVHLQQIQAMVRRADRILTDATVL